MTAGGGFGGQIGFELTDFVFILNDANAVKTFSQQGSLTLGGNVSIAAGPVGRNAEAAGAASLKGVSGIFSYSKTKGLFAGVSLEGSAIIERRDANEKMYGQRLTAAQLLGGAIPSPAQAAPLTSILNSRAFAGVRQGESVDNSMYNDSPVYDNNHDDAGWDGRHGSAPGGSDNNRNKDEFGRPSRTTTWQDDVYDRPASGGINRANTMGSGTGDDYNYRDNAVSAAGKKPPPPRPFAPKPQLKKDQAVAQFTFEADQPGDLGFKKGEVITVLKKTTSDNDWWTGSIGTRTGIFPSNYVKLQE
ncbi:SH3 domain-containing YSC84-like protein 1 [Microdochium nivale]|nr:SH3 domain-containing YSC84-like protein 1 [Microdochium nivale]